MTWDAEEIREIIAGLYLRGGDSAQVEVKRAEGGLPENLPTTVCAFANMPEGGLIILGVDEKNDFHVNGVADPAVVEAALVDQARKTVSPTPRVDTWVVPVGGVVVVVAEVQGLSVADKPATYRGKAYLRQSDGDYVMGDNELRMIEVAKLHRDEQVRYDDRELPGTSMSDLDEKLLGSFLNTVRSRSSRLSGVSDDAQLLQHMRVTTSSGALTLAGAYALGFYPQGFEPSLEVTAAVRGARAGTAARTRNLQKFSGPVPVLLEDIMVWMRTNLNRTQVYTDDGGMVDQYEFPLRAVREAVANALVHRDLGPDTLGVGKSIDIRLTDTSLVIMNPGGLRGLTVEQLKGDALARAAVNQRVYAISAYLTTGDGKRVIEGEGGGIMEMFEASRQAGLPSPDLIDSGVQFVVKFWREATPGTQPVKPVEVVNPGDFAHLGKNVPAVVRELRNPGSTGRTMKEISTATGLSLGQVRWAMKSLVEADLATMEGQQGDRTTTYRLSLAE